ncbi:hypothetical protein [Longispora urticae]
MLRKALGIAALVVVAQALLVAFFAWPAATAAPHDVPVVVAGPAPAAGALADRIRAARPGAFEVTTVADGAAADARIRNREAYAAVVLGPAGPSVHVATAASPAVAQLFTQLAATLGPAPAPVVDVVPATADDPRGAGFVSGFLPLLITGIAVSALLILLVPSRGGRLLGVVGYAAGAGLLSAAVGQYWSGTLSGSYPANAAALGLLSLAVAATITGLGSVLGTRGIGVGALVVFVVGNPLSGLASAPELLPTPWGAIGQALPPGAGASLLRSTSFFDGAGSVGPALVLAGWAVVGVALLVAARSPRRESEAVGRELVAAAPAG